MTKEQFIEHRFNEASQKLIETANNILDEYGAMGFQLSLRQLYYQLVARDYIENSLRSYKRIGSLISDARLAGLIDWEMIEDRNRETVPDVSSGERVQILDLRLTIFDWPFDCVANSATPLRAKMRR